MTNNNHWNVAAADLASRHKIEISPVSNNEGFSRYLSVK